MGRFRRKEAEREREKMRIFLALLLTLLIADTITGASTRRRKSKSKSKTKRKSSSSSGKLLKSLSKKLDDLAQAEESRDNAIEDKMDQAVEDLTNSVKNMHANLNEFINTDTAVSSRLKNQVIHVRSSVSAVGNCHGRHQKGQGTADAKAKSNYDTMSHYPDDHDSGNDDHDMESMEEVVPEGNIKRKAGRSMPELTAEENMEGSVEENTEGSVEGSSSGEREEDEAAPVAIQDPTVQTPIYQNSQYEDDDGSGEEGSGNEGGFGDYVYGDDYDA